MQVFTLVILLCIQIALSGAAPYDNGFGTKCDTSPNCKTNKCIKVQNREICTECEGDYAPIDGVCSNSKDVIDSYGCTKSGGRCISCKGDTYFLFYGGCHSTGEIAFNVFCDEVKDGKCTKCKDLAFTNPTPNVAESCILCTDTIGFNGYKGKDGCIQCFLTDILDVDPVVCTHCSDSQLAPIDGNCSLKGSHECKNGGCSACAATHILFENGCYNRYGIIAKKYVCGTEDQFELENRVYCRKCVDPSFFPEDGVCTNKDFICTQKSGGVCTSCNAEDITTIFLFSGGCYDTTRGPGRLLCGEASSGKCTNWSCDKKGLTQLGGDCILCNDPKGSVGCTECKSEDSTFVCTACEDKLYTLINKACVCAITKCRRCAMLGSTPICLECDGMLSLDQRSCVTECPSGQEVVEKRCQCGDGTVPKSDWSGCEKEGQCSTSAAGCSKCSSDGRCITCSSTMEYVSPGQTRCISFCPDGAWPLGQRCVCITGYVLSGDECTVMKKKMTGALSTQAISGIVVVCVMTLGVLAGVMVWLLVFRRKR
ncbi:Variant-specific surface protein [Giardia duodenalis]|uniref:Variant-specific surface protein n=1 Tax=Giardia intestinalis TaxID=5741 RepID=V6TUG4_GIAIN|nr:Variant-specific surface protein [Giardia intestinalis]